MTTDPIEGDIARNAGIINNHPVRVKRPVGRMGGERAKLAASAVVCLRSTIMVPTTGTKPVDEPPKPEYEPDPTEVEFPLADKAGTL